MGPDDLALRGAMFLERFFMIHPFVDGNGRVGRSILGLLINYTRTWEFTFSRSTSRRQRRRYLRTLEYTHRHVPRNNDERCKSCLRNPYWLLEKWIRGQMDPVQEYLEEAAPPSFIRPPGGHE